MSGAGYVDPEEYRRIVQEQLRMLAEHEDRLHREGKCLRAAAGDTCEVCSRKKKSGGGQTTSKSTLLG